MKEVIEQMTPYEVDQVLGSLTPAITSAYAKTMAMIGDQSRKRRTVAYHSLSFVALSQRPLTIQELLYILALEMNSTTLPTSDQLHDFKIIQSASMGIIQSKDGDDRVSFFRESCSIEETFIS